MRMLERRKFLRLLPERGTAVMDVGCSDATFLEMLDGLVKKRFGVEMDPSLSVIAKEKLGAENVVEGPFEEVDVPFRGLDAVRINHVIEHFMDPVLALTKINRSLKNNGYLIGETPNTSCISRNLFGRLWGGYSIPRHIHLFNPSTLRMLLEKTGFEVIQIENCLMTTGWSGSIQNFIVDKILGSAPPTGRLKGYLALTLLALPITAVQQLISQTPSMAFLARKVCEIG
jgi:SAM-dependent methyltransferase